MRLIDPERLKGCKKTVVLDDLKNGLHTDGWNACIDYLMSGNIHVPTIEAELVRHGQWIHDINNLYGCSECLGRETMSHKKLKPYCPNCGVKMDLVEDTDAGNTM